MKKTLMTAIILLAMSTASWAQPRTIGVRLGWGTGISYQHGFGEKSMLQINLDSWEFSFRTIQLTTTYNWIFPVKSWNAPGSWNWYAGVGVGGGIPLPRRGIESWKEMKNQGYVGVVGAIGIEYNFKFPLQLAIEYRPLFAAYLSKGMHRSYDRNTDTYIEHPGYYTGFYAGGLFDGGLMIRYKF